MSIRSLLCAAVLLVGCASFGPLRPVPAGERLSWGHPGAPWVEASGPHVVTAGASASLVDSLAFVDPASGSRVDGYVFVGASAKAQDYADALLKRYAGRDCAKPLAGLPKTGAVVISSCEGDEYTAFLKPPKAPHMLIILKGARKGSLDACTVTGTMRHLADTLKVTNPY